MCSRVTFSDKIAQPLTTNASMQRAADPGTSQQDIINLSDGDAETSSRDPICNVCGETPAAMHYGAVACVGCKGFFRRALMRADQLECLTDGSCVINKDLRTNCRSCRFQKCLKAGMKPGAVRPNREVSSKQKKKALAMPDESVDCTPTSSRQKDDWLKKMPVEMRTILMNLLNIEAKIMKTRTFPFLCFPGDTNTPASNLYPLKIKTLQELVEDPTKLKGKRSEMRYEPYRMAKNDELCSVAYRRVIAAIDWIENLAELMGGLNIEDKMILIKSCFAPLMVFKFTTRTAEVAKDQNILCLCNFCFVPRNISSAFSDSYHLGNGLVGRALDELVEPFRTYGLREEEIVCVSAMIAINPLTKGLSDNAFNKCVELRNKIQDTLFHIVKEARLSPHPPICYGHLLLSLPIVTSIANSMCENLQFAQTFSAQGEVPLLTDLFGCFPVDPLEDLLQMDDLALSPTSSNILKQTNQREKSTQTETAERRMSRKRRMDEPRSPSSFSLLRAPASFTLTEMFDDIHRESYSPERLNTSYPSTSALNQRQQVQMNPTVGRTYSLPSSVNMLPADNGATNPYQQITQHAPPSQQSQSYYPNCYSSQHWEQPPPNHHQYNGYQ